MRAAHGHQGAGRPSGGLQTQERPRTRVVEPAKATNPKPLRKHIQMHLRDASRRGTAPGAAPHAEPTPAKRRGKARGVTDWDLVTKKNDPKAVLCQRRSAVGIVFLARRSSQLMTQPKATTAAPIASICKVTKSMSIPFEAEDQYNAKPCDEQGYYAFPVLCI